MFSLFNLLITSSIFFCEPVLKLSIPVTLKPLSRKNSKRLEPIKPATPVINILNFFISSSIFMLLKSILKPPIIKI